MTSKFKRKERNAGTPYWYGTPRHSTNLQSISAYYLSTAAQYHTDVDKLLTREENADNDKADSNGSKKKVKFPKDSTKEPSSKKRKLEHIKPTKDSSIHQTIIFQELTNITARFEELQKVFGKPLLEELKDHANFYTNQNNPTAEEL